jgi:hypothetical protein
MVLRNAGRAPGAPRTDTVLSCGPLLVIAGAGSGKTNTLAHRVANLIVHGADPRRILLLTFTRLAQASELLTPGTLVKASEPNICNARGALWLFKWRAFPTQAPIAIEAATGRVIPCGTWKFAASAELPSRSAQGPGPCVNSAPPQWQVYRADMHLDSRIRGIRRNSGQFTSERVVGIYAVSQVAQLADFEAAQARS